MIDLLTAADTFKVHQRIAGGKALAQLFSPILVNTRSAKDHTGLFLIDILDGGNRVEDRFGIIGTDADDLTVEQRDLVALAAADLMIAVIA